MLEVVKSSRHRKIIGNFGEQLFCNWLSRSGFEVTIVDHTGIDVIAYNPLTDQRLGITVKSRTRMKGKEGNSVNLFSYQKGRNDRQKLLDACKTFACEPWIGVYVETRDFADLYLTSLKNYDAKYRRKGRKIDDWKMTKKNRGLYVKDADIRHIRIEFNVKNWFGSK